jgi:hypothetical protein
MDSKDKQFDDKRRKIAQLKLAKERLEAELAAFDDELSEQQAKLTAAEQGTRANQRAVAGRSTESGSSIALKSEPSARAQLTKIPTPNKPTATSATKRQSPKPQTTAQTPTPVKPNGNRKKSTSVVAPIAAASATAATVAAAEDSAARQKTQQPVKRPATRPINTPKTQPTAPIAQSTAAAATIAEQNTEATADEDGDQEEYEEEPSPSIFAIRSAPPWLISTILHVIGLCILGLYTLASIPEEEKRVILGSTIEEQEEFEELDEVTLEVEEVEFENISSESITEMDPGATNFADVTAAVEASAEGTEKVKLAKTTTGEIGNMFGTDGEGFADIGEGLAGSGTFFGKKAQGNKFVFVVDNSLSMNRGRFVTALDELMKSISRMTEKQQFYIIFFSDTAYPMFHPNPAPGMIPGTERNKERVAAWLYTVERCLKTKGELAMQRALELRPDVIYILGDGAFTDKTGPMLTALHNRRTIIHTFGMEVSEKGRDELTGIAKANRGNFTAVKPTPAAAKEGGNIKNNKSRGPIWGLKLPAVAKKKK